MTSVLATRRQFLSDTFVYFVSQVLLRFRGFVTLPVFAYWSSVEGYGVFTQVLITTSLIKPIIVFKLDAAAVRFLASEQNRNRFKTRFYTSFLSILLLSSVSCLLIITFASPIAVAIFGDRTQSMPAILLGVLILVSAPNAFLHNYFRIVRQIKLLSGFSLMQSLLELLCMIGGLAIGWGIEGAIGGLIIANVLVSLILFGIILHRLGLSVSFSFKELRLFLTYSLPLMPNSFTKWTVDYADRILIVQFLGLSSIGIYSASYSIASGINLLFAPLGFVLYPYLSMLWDTDKRDEARKYFTITTKYLAFVGLPACILIAYLSQPLLRVLANADFTSDVLLVFWVALGILFSGFFRINAYAFHLVKQTKYNVSLWLIGAVSNVGLNFLLVPVFGLNGAAFATAISFGLMAFMAIIYGERLIEYQIDWIEWSKMTIAGIVMGVTVLALVPLNLLGAIVVGASLYMIVIWITGVFTRQELETIRKIIPLNEILRAVRL